MVCVVLKKREVKLQAERTVLVFQWSQSSTLEETSRLERTRLLVGRL